MKLEENNSICKEAYNYMEDPLLSHFYDECMRFISMLPADLPQCLKQYFASYEDQMEKGEFALLLSRSSWNEIKNIFTDEKMVERWNELARTSEQHTVQLAHGIVVTPLLWRDGKPSKQKSDLELIKAALKVLRKLDKRIDHLADGHISEAIAELLSTQQDLKSWNTQLNETFALEKAMKKREHSDEDAVYRFYARRVDWLIRESFNKPNNTFVQEAVGAMSNNEFNSTVSNLTRCPIKKTKQSSTGKPSKKC